MIWACFLHFYQPPTQKKYWIDRITNESYRRIVDGLLENPQAKITLNVNSVLVELWEQYGHQEVIDGLKTLVTSGQVELTGSAKFHPLLPKLPIEQVVRQIILNEESLNKYFGVSGPALKGQLTHSTGSGQAIDKEKVVDELKGQRSNVKGQMFLKGFFPPEMAYDRNLAGIVANLGYEWMIAEELSLGKAVQYDRIYEVSELKPQSVIASEAPRDPSTSLGMTSNSQIASDRVPRNDEERQRLKIFFRDRAFSYKILAGYLGTPKLFLDELKSKFPQDGQERYLLTAMDGETFGHHRPGMEKLLLELFKMPEVQMVHISQLPSHFSQTESVETAPSTWALMEHEVEKNLPFARWDDPENQVHKLQWQLTNLSIETISHSERSEESPANAGSDKLRDSSGRTPQNDISKAQTLLDRALHSDQYWWASAKPWWSIEYIEMGAKELLEAVRATRDKVASDQAQKLYYQILETSFEYQRSGKVDEISKKEDETMRMRTDQALPKMPKEELLKIIETIRTEMRTVASNQEYERAAQLRDRIKELESYLSE